MMQSSLPSVAGVHQPGPANQERRSTSLKGRLPEKRKWLSAQRGLAPSPLHALILIVWATLICLVVAGSLLPARSPLMVAVSLLPIGDKALHFGAYLMLSSLPVAGFQECRRGVIAGLSMFVLGLLLEAAQSIAPGRAVELGDLAANGAGVMCGALVGLPIRSRIANLGGAHREGGS